MGKLRIISRNEQPFSNRNQAGRELSFELKNLKNLSPVIVGILRGGIVIAREIAQNLEAELDIALSRKLQAPDNPELAIGAVTETGEVMLNNLIVSLSRADTHYIEEEKQRQLELIENRKKAFRGIKPKIPLTGRVVVATDDGVATGSTFRSTLWSIIQEKPQKIIAAVPVSGEKAMQRIAWDAQEAVCLKVPAIMPAIGQFYIDFEQVSDTQVIEILRTSPALR